MHKREKITVNAKTSMYLHGMCIVSTRYRGVYEGGNFGCIPQKLLKSAWDGDDCSCAEWWDEHKHLVGVGDTPDAALQNWYDRQSPDFHSY